MTLLDCFDIIRTGMGGRLNYKTGEILEPRFEYIIPSGKMPTPVAYGFSNGAFYEIDASDLGDIKPAQFDLQTSLSELEFDVTSHSGKYFQYSYAKASSEKARQKVLIVPSWIEVHDLMQGQVFWDLIIDENSKNNVLKNP